MSLHRRVSVWISAGVIGAILACSSNAHAELLGYWSANSPNEDFALKNDQGNGDLDGELFGDAAYTDDQGGVTGAAGDYALSFNGVPEDYAALPHSEDVTFEEITLTAWMKGEHTGDWSGIFYSRGGTALGLGYGGGSGNLTYTWNDNVAETWNFGAGQPQLNIPPDEWTFVALTIEPDNATLYVGPQGGVLESATNEIPHIPQLPVAEWRLAQDACCGTARNFLGEMDDAAIWNHRLTAGQLSEIHSGSKLPNDPSFAEREGGLRQVQVGGGGLGTESLTGSLSNIVKGDPVESEGLAQFWFDGNMRGPTAVENYQGVGETGNETFPLVTSGPINSTTTWWAGNGALTVRGEDLPRYPAGLAGTRFDGSANEENYGVILKGEIFIAENGEYLVRDGIDDWAMVAIDQDGNDELDELADILDADAGTLFPGDPIGDVLILDDAWSSVAGGNQTEAEHGIATIENVEGDGDWRAIQIWMGEAGGGDSGTLYIGNLDDPDIFDETDGAALSQDQIDKFLVPNDQLRSTVAPVVSGDSSAALRDNVEYVVQVGPDGSDGFAVDDNGGVYTTTLDVAGANIRIATDGELADGTVVNLFDADVINGLETLTLLFDDASLWDLSGLANGVLTFGTKPVGDTCEALAASRVPGDADGNGEVAFGDFLALANGFGTDAGYEGGDFDCNGEVAFNDFLTLANNFGATAAASSVPEPSSVLLIGLGAMLMGFVRRRRS